MAKSAKIVTLEWLEQYIDGLSKRVVNIEWF
jgi:hypothetical protein